MASPAYPDVLVSTDWVAEHANEPGIVLAEVNVDHELYTQGHIPGAVGWSWKTQLCDPVRRDIVSKADLEALLGASGADENSTIVLYGDHNNWFAAWAFWQLKLYGHRDLRLMDGGRKKWEKEGRPLTTEPPQITPRAYRAQEPDLSLRAFLPEVMQRVARSEVDLVDVRSPQEFTGEVLAPPGLPETCQRGGHIPGAYNVTWSRAVNEDDGTFRSVDELRALYSAEGVTGERPVITYCRIGERSSHSWFVLKYLLGYPDVKNYDGSWTEWGNLVGVDIETGPRGAAA
ncbi:MAG TPA: sulfurtransferase [Rubricoccaceae bacterium]|nr:sulfurtransferase [Rubricoccaceae bacterium]